MAMRREHSFFRNNPTLCLELLFLLVIALSVSCPSFPAFAGTVEPDPLFGNGGIVSMDFSGSGNNDHINSVVVDASGDIIAGGYTKDGTLARFAIARYTSDGILDTSFGIEGKISMDFGGTGDTSEINSMALDKNGNIVAGGFGDSKIAIARYTPAGVLDTSFSSDGKVSVDFGGATSRIFSLAVSDNDDIIAGGYAADNFALVRCKPDGTSDPSFGSGGVVSTDFDGHRARIYSLALDTSGNIMAGGYTTTNDDKERLFAVARYSPAGALDTSFGLNGKVSMDLGTNSYGITSITLDEMGRILIGGSLRGNTGRYRFAVARCTADGAMDGTFGTGGIVSTDLGGDGDSDYITSLAIDEDGRIIAGGYTNNNDFAVTRYTADGKPDMTFGPGGFVSTDFGGTYDHMTSMALVQSGDIIAGGFSTGNFALVKYIEIPQSDMNDKTDSSGCNVTTFSGSALLLFFPLALLLNGKRR